MLTAASREGDLEDAKRIFATMPGKNLVTWNAMYTAYAQNGDIPLAKDLFEKIPERNLVSWNIMIFVYGEVGNVEKARLYFDDTPERNIISWNLMIAAYAHKGYPREAHGIFHNMVLHGSRIDEMTFSSVLVACSHIGLVREARNYFVTLILDFELTPLVEHYCCLVDALGRAGKLQTAEDLIDSMPFSPSDVALASLVSASRIYNDPIREARAAMALLDVDSNDSSAYLSLSRVFASDGS
ncbi:pentatricopeptide repeat-containing protein At3g29230 [Selaginella moellendorffii]|nr:pentatricopeptide repeat-containing protein At3g29230 [Selaginella moellendorffii]|eukprot:XP_002977265.2 pentatricopeptide repeat-containing protein At3g29230 [Selaginella moellendorffii]